MCETRNDNRSAIKSRRESDDDTTRQPRPPRSFNRRSGPPRINDDEWVLVRRPPGQSRSYGNRRLRRQEPQGDPQEESRVEEDGH